MAGLEGQRVKRVRQDEERFASVGQHERVRCTEITAIDAIAAWIAWVRTGAQHWVQCALASYWATRAQQNVATCSAQRGVEEQVQATGAWLERERGGRAAHCVGAACRVVGEQTVVRT